MGYTVEQQQLIEGLLDSHFLGRKLSDSLHASFLTAYQHLCSNTLDRNDLRRIESALEFMTPTDCCQTCNIEGYRAITEALIATRALLQKCQGVAQ